MNVAQWFQKRLARKRTAYRQCFFDDNNQLTQAGRTVFADLAKFCRAQQSTAIVSPISRTVDIHASMLAVGRLEVYNRILAHLHISDAEILRAVQDETQTALGGLDHE
jgi:hypothetical protein